MNPPLVGRDSVEPRPLNYREALAWLYGLQRFGIKLGLENIRRLIAELHIDLAKARVIHVAGTNGKGSVCAMIEAICRVGGLTTGLFTSPHLVTFRERIQIDGEMVSEEAVAAGLTAIRHLARDWDPHPTFFEIVTALALKHFADSSVDVVVLETGLGGRLDATNAVQSDVAVITPIGFDHQKWLGDTLDQIASEKAGIVKLKRPVISSRQERDAEKVIRARAKECDSPIEIVTKSYSKSPIALRGEHQKRNAALAIAAIRAAKIKVDEAAIGRGLMSVEWPARFQTWDKRTIIDGAHNAAAAKTLVQTWRETFGSQQCTLILAILVDKDLRAICEVLAPIADSVLLPPMRGERASDPSAIGEIFSEVALSVPYSVIPTIPEAIEFARTKPNPILITGSLHFAGEVLSHLQGKPAAFEECAQ